MTNTVTFNLTTYQRLKKEYQVAYQKNLESFIFEGNEYLTSYAKYLLEYLKLKFE